MSSCLFCSDEDLLSSWERLERKGASLAPSVWMQVYGREEMNCCVAKAVAMGPIAHFDLIASLRVNTLRWLKQKYGFLISSVLIMLLMERKGNHIFKIDLILLRKSYLPHLQENDFFLSSLFRDVSLSWPTSIISDVLCILTVCMALCEYVWVQYSKYSSSLKHFGEVISVRF